MRRRDVSPEELAKVVTLRQSATSWLQIQRDTGIPRRIAKRAYEEWGRSQSREELKAARKDVAVDEFRNHLASLVKLAEFLVKALDIPEPSPHPIGAKEVLHNLWQQDIVGEYGAYGLLSRDEVSYSRRSDTWNRLRQNQLLFQSLRDHTHGKVDWEILDQWGNARDECTRAQVELREEASEILLNILKQKQGVIDRLAKGREEGKQQLMEQMVDGILHAVWQNILAGKPDQSPAVQTRSVDDVRAEVVFGEHDPSRNLISHNLRFTGTGLAEEAKDICVWVANNLGIERREDMYSLVKDVGTMRKAIDQLTGMLNPLMLRPMILQTRCDLCPA